MSAARLEIEQRMREVEDGAAPDAQSCLDMAREIAEAFARYFYRMKREGRALPPSRITLRRKQKRERTMRRRDP